MDIDASNWEPLSPQLWWEFQGLDLLQNLKKHKKNILESNFELIG